MACEIRVASGENRTTPSSRAFITLPSAFSPVSSSYRVPSSMATVDDIAPLGTLGVTSRLLVQYFPS